MDKKLFVISVYSQTQDKRYLVSVIGKYTGKQGDYVQLSGELKSGAIYYINHRTLLSTSPSTTR